MTQEWRQPDNLTLPEWYKQLTEEYDREVARTEQEIIRQVECYNGENGGASS